MTQPTGDVVTDLAPTGVLRASINLGNPVLAQGSPDAPTGVTVDIALQSKSSGRVASYVTRFAVPDNPRRR
jgi:hypothetical protein